MPLYQDSTQESLSDRHLEWLSLNYPNVRQHKFDLSDTFDSFLDTMGPQFTTKHAEANSRSRLRMITLYQIAACQGGVVVGTGNKVEDYGVGFYTKYGDGGVDIAPIADLYKTQVWGLGEYMGICKDIIDAEPTDGLWDDKRTDESQLGVSYEMLEWVMESGIMNAPGFNPNEMEMWRGVPITEEQRAAIIQYDKFNTMNKHKMLPIPTFKLEKSYAE
jgi:NAD+ synthase